MFIRLSLSVACAIFCIHIVTTEYFISMLKDKNTPQIIDFFHTTAGQRENHSARFSVEMTVAWWLRLWLLAYQNHSETPLFIRKCNFQRKEEEISSVSRHCSCCYLFLSYFLFSPPSTCTRSEILCQRGKLPHTTLSFNQGPKEIILLLLPALKLQLSSTPFFTPFSKAGNSSSEQEIGKGDFYTSQLRKTQMSADTNVTLDLSASALHIRHSVIFLHVSPTVKSSPEVRVLI